MTNAKLIDVSIWQDDNSTPQQMNFEMARAQGVEGVFIKASQGTWIDQDLLYNWESAHAAGLLRGAYHFFSWDKTPVAQARYFWSLVQNSGDLPLVCDYEMRTGAPGRTEATARLSAFLQELEGLSGKTPMIYTSNGFWREFGNSNASWRHYPLWVANYYVTQPAIPSPWSEWRFWQWTDRGDGHAHGAESAQLDLDWYNGTTAELYAWLDLTPAEPPEPEPRVFQVRSLIDGLRIRQTPSTAAPIIGRLAAGDVVDVADINGDVVWLRLTIGGYVAYRYLNQGQLAEIVV